VRQDYIVVEESSVNGILGRRGHGKSTLLAKIGEDDYNLGKKIITNFWVSYPHIYMSFEDIIMLPEELQDATLLLDELQVGAGARKALSLSNQDINKFITQLRKRNIMLFYTTQNYKFIDVDIRSQTDYLITTQKTENLNQFKVIVVDRNDFTDSKFGSVINLFILDATDIFERKIFDTKQIINFGKEEDYDNSKRKKSN